MKRPGQSTFIYFCRLVKAIALAMVFFLSVQAQAALELKASWYSVASLIEEGTWKNGEQRMANGQIFNDNKLTAASRLYPIGTRIKVTNRKNKQYVVVTITDRIGKKFARTRIDLSKSAFERIASLKTGLVPIKSEVYHGK